ncbi:unnamed protein product, partial [Urochloa humidicola]
QQQSSTPPALPKPANLESPLPYPCAPLLPIQRRRRRPLPHMASAKASPPHLVAADPLPHPVAKCSSEASVARSIEVR